MAEKPETARWSKVNLHQWEPLALCVSTRPSRSGRAGELLLQLVDSRLRKKEWTEGVLTPGDLGLTEDCQAVRPGVCRNRPCSAG